MKSLSQSEYGELRGLYESVYAPKFESILDEFTDEDLDDLTDEYIEEQVTEFFQECLEEGLDIEIVEQTICESIDSSLDLLTERVDPKETQRRRDQAKDRLATSRAMRSAASKSTSSTPDKKANRLAQIKGVVKKVGEIVKGGVGLSTRAVGTAQRAGSAVMSAAKKGYERGRQGPGGGSSTSSAGTSSSGSSTSSAGTSSSGSSTSSAGTSSADSSGGDSSTTPARRKDGLLKRGLKKLVRGASKAVSVGAGAVKAGADYVTDRARKEQMNYNDVATIQELYNSIYETQKEEYIDEADSIAAMRERAAKRRKQRYGASDTSRGGRDDFRPYTKADYERGEANDPRKKIEELYKGKHGQSDKEYADSRSPGGKMVSGDSKQSGAEYTHGRRVKAANPGMQPDVGGKTRPKSQGKMDRGTRADLEYRKANLNREELELDQMIESLIERGHTEKEAYALVAQFTFDEGVIDFVKAGVDRHKSAMKGAEAAKKRHDAGVKKLGKTVKPVVDDAKKAAKKGAEIAGAVGRGIQAAAKLERRGAAAVHAAGRKMKAAKKAAMSTEDLEFIAQYVIDEGYDLSDYTWEEFAEICESQQLDEDSRRMSNKQHTARVRANIKSFGSNYTPPSNYDPDANRGQGEVVTRKQMEKKRRKALRQEDYVNESQEARNNPEKYEREQSKKYAPVRGEKTPMPPRGDKRREDFEKWYAAQRR